MVFRRINKRVIFSVDWQLIVLVVLLSLVGLAVLRSAGFNPETGLSPPMRRQAFSMGLGAVAFLFCMFFKPTAWRQLAYFIYGLGCILLILTLFQGVVAGGAKRWLMMGGFRIQPSEFMKLGLILAMARIFSAESAPKDGYTFLRLFVPCFFLSIPVVLILVEPDLGTALCHILIGGSMLLFAGIRGKTFMRLVLVAMLLAIPAWKLVLKDYQRQRVLTFLSPEQDPLGSGYHAIQSKIAVGSGAVTGKGYLQGTQTQLSFLPEQTTDFVFSVLAEEWGFIGSISVLLLYAMLIARLLTISAKSAEDPFASFVAFGVAALIFWHVVINIGMVVGVLPVVGLTLALLSYGGSSVFTLLASLGIVAGFSMRRFIFG